MIKRLVLCLLLATSLGAVADEKPAPSQSDYRVTYVEYDPDQVVNLHVHFGFQTHIVFSPTEVVQRVVFGDSLAWAKEKTGNHLFIKPKAKEPSTNMVVITSRRTYNFDLDGHVSKSKSKSNDMVFQLTFLYPEEEKAFNAREKERELIKKTLEEGYKDHLANWNYWKQGDDSIAPKHVYDDGQFTYLSFSPNQDMPAVYTEVDGAESLINTNVKDRTIVVHRVVEKFVLRVGKRVVCIFNKSYDPEGVDVDTGTKSSRVKRKIKGAE